MSAVTPNNDQVADVPRTQRSAKSDHSHPQQARAQQIADKFAPGPEREPWIEVAEFASYCAQTNALRLKSWQWPQCWIEDIDAALGAPDDAKQIRSAALLLQRMQRLGVSKFHPNPAAECERVEAERKAAP